MEKGVVVSNWNFNPEKGKLSGNMLYRVEDGNIVDCPNEVFINSHTKFASDVWKSWWNKAPLAVTADSESRIAISVSPAEQVLVKLAAIHAVK